LINWMTSPVSVYFPLHRFDYRIDIRDAENNIGRPGDQDLDSVKLV